MDFAIVLGCDSRELIPSDAPLPIVRCAGTRVRLRDLTRAALSARRVSPERVDELAGVPVGSTADMAFDGAGSPSNALNVLEALGVKAVTLPPLGLDGRFA